MPRIKFLKTITLCGSELPAGTIDEVDAVSAAALIAEGAAEAVAAEVTEERAPGNDTTPPNSESNAEVEEIDTEAITMAKKALDAQYKRDDLAEAAKAVGVEFPYDARKPDIINAVIFAEKQAQLLK